MVINLRVLNYFARVPHCSSSHPILIRRGGPHVRVRRPDILAGAATVVLVEFLVVGCAGSEAAEAVAEHGAEGLHAGLVALGVLVFSG